MRFRIANRCLCNYSREYEAVVLERYMNGFKVRLDNGSIAQIHKSDIKIYEISEEESRMPIHF